jgi:hypothetical protein
MNNKVIVFILAVSVLIYTLCFAETQVTGIAKSFDPQSGRLVLQAAGQVGTTMNIPQTVKVYLQTPTEEKEMADAWNFLRDNLLKGTKVKILQSEGVVTAVCILEVPM